MRELNDSLAVGVFGFLNQLGRCVLNKIVIVGVRDKDVSRIENSLSKQVKQQFNIAYGLSNKASRKKTVNTIQNSANRNKVITIMLTRFGSHAVYKHVQENSDKIIHCQGGVSSLLRIIHSLV